MPPFIGKDKLFIQKDKDSTINFHIKTAGRQKENIDPKTLHPLYFSLFKDWYNTKSFTYHENTESVFKKSTVYRLTKLPV